MIGHALAEQSPDLAAVFRAEIIAARLEGALRADPGLAGLWRAEAAVLEACASAWLEDLPVTPGGLLCRGIEGLAEPEADRAIRSAAAFLRVLSAPGDIARDTVAALERLWAMGSRGQGPPPFTAGDIADIRAVLAETESPILGAIAVSRIVNRATEGRTPAVERLSFVAADHALRGGGRFMRGGTMAQVEPHELVGVGTGNWVLQPSVALTDNGFRLWSVTRPQGVEDLLLGLGRTLERALGTLSLHRRWLDRANDVAASAHGSSALPRLVGLLKRQPVIASWVVRQRLNLSDRGALKVTEAALEAGLVRCITPRNSYRFYATGPFAELIGRG